MSALVDASSTFQRLATTDFEPANRNASTRLLTPSCPCTLPTPLSQAESVVSSAFSRNLMTSRNDLTKLKQSVITRLRVRTEYESRSFRILRIREAMYSQMQNTEFVQRFFFECGFGSIVA